MSRINLQELGRELEIRKPPVRHSCRGQGFDIYYGNPFKGLNMPGVGNPINHDGPTLSVEDDEYIFEIKFCPLCGAALRSDAP